MVQPLILGLVILGLTVGNDDTAGHDAMVDIQPPHVSEHLQKAAMPPLPLPDQTRARVLQSQLTRATMTGHKLTEAHFFGRQDLSELSAETSESLNNG